MTGLVSIVIPFFNAKNTLERALTSIEMQTVKLYEVILVDDCSTDGSATIAKDWVDVRSGHQYIRLPINSGAGVARRVGLSAAKGEFLAFLDADDFWFPEKLSEQLRYFEDPAVIIVHSGYRIFSRKMKILGDIVPRARLKLSDFYFSNRIATSTAILRGNLNNSRNMPAIRARQDYGYWIIILSSNVGKVVGLQRVLAGYCRSPGSVSSSLMRNLVSNFKLFHSELRFPVVMSLGLVFLNSGARVYKALLLFVRRLVQPL